jgi:hypothetical protein
MERKNSIGEPKYNDRKYKIKKLPDAVRLGSLVKTVFVLAISTTRRLQTTNSIGFCMELLIQMASDIIYPHCVIM